MKLASISQITADFPVYLKASARGPVVVTRNGKPIAVLLRTTGQEDLERLLMGHSPELQVILEGARKRFRAGAGIPHDAFWNEVEAEPAGRTKKPRSARGNARTRR